MTWADRQRAFYSGSNLSIVALKEEILCGIQPSALLPKVEKEFVLPVPGD